MEAFRVGARDWERPEWASGFYPGDMPPEWRLSYYANEFNAVLLPPRRWLGVRDGVIAEWADDVHEAFRFFLELPPDRRALGRAEAVTELLGGLCGGVLPVPGTDGPSGVPAYQSLGPPGPPGVTRFRASGPEGGGDLLLVELTGGLALLRLRGLLDGSGAGGTRVGGVFFEADVLDTELMHQARLMGELMGLG